MKISYSFTNGKLGTDNLRRREVSFNVETFRWHE